MKERLMAILLELHSEYEHGPAAYALIEEAIGLLNPMQPLVSAQTEEDSAGVRSLIWNDETTGVPWLAYIVRPGEEYGIETAAGGRALVNTGSQPLVEFWDRRYSHDRQHRAQFVSRYHLDTLLDHVGGLDLMGYEPSWKLDDRSFGLVHRFLLRPVAARLAQEGA